MGKYTWVITENDVPGDVSSAFAKIGPSGSKDRMSLGQVIPKRRAISDCWVATRKLRFTGYIHGEYSGPEPLNDYGLDNECVDIEYDVGDRWAALDGTTREKISG